MTDAFGHDRDLARRTRASHISFFILGTLLVPTAIYALMVAGGLSPRFWSLEYWAAATTSACGVMAWVALGLLFFKRSSPKWHLGCWPWVGLFGILAVPSTLLWLVREFGTGDLTGILVAALAGAIASVWFSARHCRLALKSLKRSKSAAGLQPGASGR